MTDQPETFHACPPGVSGLTPCCGRTPFELPRGDRISSETVTCTGPRLEWAESVASHGSGPTATVDIDVTVPGQPEPAPLEIPLDAARTLHAMLGDLLAEHAPTPSADLREQYAAAIVRGGGGVDLAAATDAVLAVRDRELQQLRAEAAEMRQRFDNQAQAATELIDERRQLEEQLVAARSTIDRVRELHQPIKRGPLTICALCSGWDGEWRCRGIVTDFPCPTVHTLGECPQCRAAGACSGGPCPLIATEQTPLRHLGDGANAEDCPACSGTNPPYPFICPGPASA